MKAALKARRKRVAAAEEEKQRKKEGKEGGIKWLPLLFLLVRCLDGWMDGMTHPFIQIALFLLHLTHPSP